MNIALLFTIAAFSFGFALLTYALYIFSRYQHTAHIKLFSFFALLLGAWMITNGVVLISGDHALILEIAGRSMFVFAGLAFTIFYLFALNYPFPKHEMSIDEATIAFLPWGLLASGIYFSKSIIFGFENGPFSYTIFGPAFWLFILYASVMTFLSVLVMLRTKKRLDNTQARGVGQILWYSVIASVIGISTSLVAPFYMHVRESPWALMAVALIWVVLLTQVITKTGSD